MALRLAVGDESIGLADADVATVHAGQELVLDGATRRCVVCGCCCCCCAGDGGGGARLGVGEHGRVVHEDGNAGVELAYASVELLVVGVVAEHFGATIVELSGQVSVAQCRHHGGGHC